MYTVSLVLPCTGSSQPAKTSYTCNLHVIVMILKTLNMKEIPDSQLCSTWGGVGRIALTM